MRNKFKNFAGEFIPDIVEYLKDYINKCSNVTISVGCDSIQKRRKTVYAITVMMYDMDVKNGAHVVFFRESSPTKIRDHFERLQREALYSLELAEMLNQELAPFYKRLDITDQERRKYKFHLARCDGQFEHVQKHHEDTFISNLQLSDAEKIVEYKLVDIHVDYNPFEGNMNKKGIPKNKSNVSYRAMVPYLKGMGYRVFSKPQAHAASSAADLLVNA